MERKKILVTGGMGYIGSHTVVELLEAGFEPIIADNLSNSQPSVLDGIERICQRRPRWYKIDCSDSAALSDVFSQENGIAAAIHFAAYKAVGESVEAPLPYYHNNILSLVVLMEVMKQYGCRNLVFSSSCTVYGQAEQMPVDEASPILPATSPYGYTKQVNEQIVRDVCRADPEFSAVLLRYFNPIGAHASAEIGELPIGVPSNLIPFLTQAVSGIRPELQVFGNDYNTPDGSCIRDYIHVVDLAKAHVTTLVHMLQGKAVESPEVFNIGTGKGVSVLEIIETFQRVTGIEVPYRIAPRRAGDIEQIRADTAKVESVLGWHAESTLAETLRSAWQWQVRLNEALQTKTK